MSQHNIYLFCSCFISNRKRCLTKWQASTPQAIDLSQFNIEFSSNINFKKVTLLFLLQGNESSHSHNHTYGSQQKQTDQDKLSYIITTYKSTKQFPGHQGDNFPTSASADGWERREPMFTFSLWAPSIIYLLLHIHESLQVSHKFLLEFLGSLTLFGGVCGQNTTHHKT